MVLKTLVLVIGLAVAILTWFGFRTIDDQAQQIDNLEQQIKKKDNQISYLKETNQEQNEVNEGSSAHKIKDSVEIFVESVFEVQEGNYQDRKGQAETVLTQSMLKEIFPEEDEYTVMYEYAVDQIHSYVDQKDEEASAFVTFEQEVTNTKNKKENDSYVTIEVFLQKEGERWLINEFKQIQSEPL